MIGAILMMNHQYGFLILIIKKPVMENTDLQINLNGFHGKNVGILVNTFSKTFLRLGEGEQTY